MGNMLPWEFSDVYPVPTLNMLLRGTQDHQVMHSTMWSLSAKSFSSGSRNSSNKEKWDRGRNIQEQQLQNYASSLQTLLASYGKIICEPNREHREEENRHISTIPRGKAAIKLTSLIQQPAGSTDIALGWCHVSFFLSNLVSFSPSGVLLQ